MKKFSIIAFAFVFSLSSGGAALAAGPSSVDLLSAGNFAVLAKTGISTTGATSVVGDIGISPAAATYITGFGLNLTAGSSFATSSLVDGKVYAPGYANPTPANITAAVSAMETAYTDGMGRTNPTSTELGAGNIGGMTLAPGLYKWSTGVTIPTDVTLSGSANDVWIFQIAQNLDISAAKKVILSGGAKAGNVFWIVAGQTTLGTTSVFNGNVLDQTAIVLNTGAKLNGRALAQTAVTLDSSSVTSPEVSAPATPAIPSTPAVPTINPAVPATPAIPASNNSGNNSGVGSITTTHSGTTSTTTTTVHTPATPAAPAAQAFGQQVRAIAVSLGKGSRGNSVTTLQQFLISQDKGPAAKSLAKVGTSTYFGTMTRAALAEFQAKVGISPALGNFGSITRAYLMAHY